MEIMAVIGFMLIAYVLFFMPMSPTTRTNYPPKYRCPLCDWPMHDIRDKDCRAVERFKYQKQGCTSGHWCGFCCSDRIR